MTKFLFLPAPAGAGKTRALVRHAHRLALRGRKVLFVQPSKLLIDRTVSDELAQLDPVRHRIIHGETEAGRVVPKIVAHFEKTEAGGEVVFITHAAFLLLPWLRNRRNWHVIIDEVPQVDVFEELTLPDSYGLLTPLLELEPQGATHGLLLGKNGAGLNQIARKSRDNDVYRVFEGLLGRVASGHWDVFVRQDQFADLAAGRKEGGGKLTTHSLLAVHSP